MPKTIDGVECYNTGESAKYLGVSGVTFPLKVAAYNNEHPDDKIEIYRDNLRSGPKYYRKTDLDKLKGWRAKTQ